MSSRRCEYGCRPPYQSGNRPCKACREKHERDMDRSFHDYVEQQEARTAAEYAPATDAEWRSYLDQVAPVVIEENPFTFTFFA